MRKREWFPLFIYFNIFFPFVILSEAYAESKDPIGL
jgi:hypothetical protein